MLSEMVGFGGNYCSVRALLIDKQIIDIAFKINNSDRFEFGENSHVVLIGTDTIVGYVGHDTAELCWPEGQDQKRYRTPHSHLRRIFNSAR